MEIKIFNIARTQVDRTEVQKWLDYMGTSCEIPKNISDPALLVALAGKNCYKSFEEGYNPNVTKVRKEWDKYLQNILSSGHGCYDAETEVMTKNGWKFFYELDGTEEFATLDKDHNIHYVPCVRRINYDYSGDMYLFKGCNIDLFVTPNHNVYISHRSNKWKPYTMWQAKDAFHKSHKHTKIAYLNSTDTEIPPDVAKLIGFSIGDGSVDGNRVYYHLRRKRKILWLKQLVSKLNWRFEEKIKRDHYQIYIPLIYKSLFHDIYDANKEKHIPIKLMFSAQPVLEGLLEGLIASDGSISKKNTKTYDTTSIKLFKQIQQLCLHLGGCADLSNIKTNRKRSYGKKPLYRLAILSRNLHPNLNKLSNKGTRVKKIENWSGPVYCVELPDEYNKVELLHTLYVKRGGKCIWSGNSVLEHSTYSFAIEGITRVAAAELNRHKTGFAISEQSLRYVRFDGSIPFWMPHSICESPEDPPEIAHKKELTRKALEESFSAQYKTYKELVELWDLDNHDFHFKKKMTSLFRRIVGMGVSTSGVWTGNLRALRHVIALRSDPSAEEEIAYIFGEIGKFMVEHEPLLFGDFTLKDGFWYPKYEKV